MSTAVVEKQQQGGALVPSLDGPNLKAVESVLMKGDLTELTTDQRIGFYKALCESLQLNWMTRPFGYIVMNGKLTLYAQKDCTEQLRRLFNVSVTSLQKDYIEGSYVVTAKLKMPGGRCDESTGAVWIKGLVGDNHCNAIMKAETKAKRRGTLSICGLGFVVDESETGSIKGAKIVDESYIPEAPKDTPGTVMPPVLVEERAWRPSTDQSNTLHQIRKDRLMTMNKVLELCENKKSIQSQEEYDRILKTLTAPDPSEEGWNKFYQDRGDKQGDRT